MSNKGEWNVIRFEFHTAVVNFTNFDWLVQWLGQHVGNAFVPTTYGIIVWFTRSEASVVIFQLASCSISLHDQPWITKKQRNDIDA